MLACTGLATLPARGWAVALILAAMLAFAVDVQVGVPRFWTGVGVVLTIIGSLWLFEPLPASRCGRRGSRCSPGIGGAVLAFVVGMPSMVRTRFATPTIGREWMIGELGEVVEAVDPDGVVSVRSARWRARTNRATPVAAGEPVRWSPSTASRWRSSRSRAPPRTTASGGGEAGRRRLSPSEPCVNTAADPLPGLGRFLRWPAVIGVHLMSGSSRRLPRGHRRDFYPPMHTERKHERLARSGGPRRSAPAARCARVPRARHRGRRALRHLGRPHQDERRQLRESA